MQFGNLTDKQAVQAWSEFVENVRRATAVANGETEEQKRTRIAWLEKEGNDEEWYQYYFPQYAYAEPADFHIAASRRFMKHMEWCEVWQWSRELAKSTRKMMKSLKAHLTKKKRFTMMVSNSLDNAMRLLDPWRANLEANQRIIQDYGPQMRPGKWEAGDFTTLSGNAFIAIGAGQSPRGLRADEARPDDICFDDIDTDEECRNPTIIEKKWKWIEEAAIGTRSISRDTWITFLGNKIAKDCCVARAEKIADHVSVVNIRDTKGKSTWPQKNTEQKIDRVLKQKSYAAYMKEYFNTPIEEGAVFKEMYWKKLRPLKEYSLLVCYTDPSFKDSKRNDFKATVLIGKYRDEYHVLKAFVDQTSTANMIAWHYELMDYVGAAACYYLMEQVFLQDIIIGEFYAAGKKSGRTIPISGDQRQKPDKFTRIESLLEPLNRNGKLYLNEAERHNPGMQRLEDQFKALAPGSRAHDDGPDAVEGAVFILNQKLAGYSGGVETFRRPTNPKRY